MAKIKVDGFDNFEKQLNQSISEIHNINKMGLYEGAKVIADEVNKMIDTIPDNCLLNEREKDDLHNGLTISRHMDTDDGVETYISFAGYNQWVDGPSAPTGDPIILIARSISKGSSMRKGKYKFMDKSKNNKRKVAEEAIKTKIEDEITKLQ